MVTWRLASACSASCSSFDSRAVVRTLFAMVLPWVCCLSLDFGERAHTEAQITDQQVTSNVCVRARVVDSVYGHTAR